MMTHTMSFDWTKLTTHQLEVKKSEYLGHLETSKRRKSSEMVILRKGWKRSVNEITSVLSARKGQDNE